MTPFLAFMVWLFLCWMVTIYSDAPLQPQWADLGSDVVSRAMRMRHIRQGVRRG